MSRTQLLDYLQKEEHSAFAIQDSRVLIFNATHHGIYKNISDKNQAIFYNPLKEEYDRLKQAGLSQVVYDLGAGAEPETFDHVIVPIGKDKQETLFHIGFGLFLLKTGGVLSVYGENDLGIQGYEKQLDKIGVKVENVFKHKSRFYWGEKQTLDVEVLKEWIGFGVAERIKDSELEAIPGLFSADRLDKGSQILCEHLPAKLKGHGGDFGCGYGFLSYHILANEAADSVSCFDHDRRAVDCARSNLSSFISDDSVITFHWEDLTKEGVQPNSLDWVLMNPPFHSGGKKHDINLGVSFIKQAHTALKKKGILYMVANNQLPYEMDLANLFFNVDKVFEGQGFKVFVATK